VDTERREVKRTKFLWLIRRCKNRRNQRNTRKKITYFIWYDWYWKLPK